MNTQQNGFTLVELAIVLMIIGLLIGGVLRGQELLSNARINATVQQIKAYQAAYVSFQDMYNNLPGDMVQATARVPGCTTGNSCTNGNGDGKVGTPLSPIAAIDGPSENFQMWKQLALTHLITGVDPSINPNTAASVGWGRSLPSAKINGGFQFIYMDYGITGDTTRASWVGSFIRLQPNVTGGLSEIEGQYAISPKQASQIDRKMDDGQPGTGDVLSLDAGVAPASGRCEMPNPYDEWSDRLNCVIFIRM